MRRDFVRILSQCLISIISQYLSGNFKTAKISFAGTFDSYFCFSLARKIESPLFNEQEGSNLIVSQDIFPGKISSTQL